MYLALALGMTVKQLRSNIDSPELTNWKAFERVYGPLIGGRLESGIVASVTANCHRGRNSSPYTPADFMWAYKGGETHEQTDEGIEAAINAALARFGGS